MKKNTPSDFWARTTKSPTSCWLWVGHRNSDGYGTCHYQGKLWKAHRLAWVLFHGAVPPDTCVLHRCDTPACVRPDHLQLGTHLENMQDMVAKGRKRVAVGKAHGSRTRPDRVARGERHGQAKLTATKAMEARALYAKGGVTQRVLAGRFGVSQAAIAQLLRGQTWDTITYSGVFEASRVRTIV